MQFIPHHVNGVKVEQRNTDGFINGTAMCVAHNKDMYEWFAREQTYDNFKYLANDLGIILNTEKNGDSFIAGLSATKYAEIFPGLIFGKRGSPLNGGGTWIHPDLAVDLASYCSPPFAIQVARWVREWFATGKNPVQVDTDLNQEAILWQQRHDIRVYLKDFLRPELMDAVVKYALENKISPRKLCSKVHDTINERVQGIKSKQIKSLYGLPLGDLIRDYFETNPLLSYAAINKLAKNRIEDSGIEPITAVHQACDMYLGAAYDPKPFKPVENIHAQGRRIRKARNQKSLNSYQQLSLFPNDEAV